MSLSVRLLAAVAMFFAAALSVFAVVPSTSYVQRGLLCHFDALDNAGRGSHSSSATTWVDLTGNGNDATVHFDDGKGNALKGYWGSRALSSTHKTSGVYADFVPVAALREVLNSDGPWTIEIVDAMDNENQDTGGCLEFGKKNSFGKTHAGTDFRGYFWIRGKNSDYTDVNGPTMKHSIPRVVTYTHDGTNINRYRNGLADWFAAGKSYLAAPKTGTKPLGETDKLSILYHFVGDMMAVRVYNRVLSANEMKYNVEIDRDRFFFRSAVGLSTVETADATALKVKVTAKCPAGSGTVSINDGTAGTSVEQTVDFGSSVTIAFAPAAGFAAHGWVNVPYTTDTRGATVTFTADRAVNAHVLTEARTVHYVSLAGDNAADGSAAHPWRGIQHAVANSAVKDFDEVRVQGGLYEESVMLSEDAECNLKRSRVTITGSYKTDWTRDLVNARTIIKPAAHASPVIQDYNSFSNVVDGVDLTGGRVGYGFGDELTTSRSDAQPTSLSTLLRHCFITNNYSHGTAAYGYKTANDQPRAGIRCVSCYIADNGGWGYGSSASDTQCANRLFTNCTIVRNGAGGIRSKINYGRGATFCRNLILSDNGGPELSCNAASVMGYCRFANAIVHTGAVGYPFAADDSGVGDNGNVPAIPVMCDVFPVDPKLDASGRPTAGSYANKSGCDGDAEPAAAAMSDVYGNAWEKGAYDIGCFKTEHAVAATRRSLADVYVATDGDDATDGTAAHPLATLEEALWRVAPNGVCHLGEGMFLSEISVLSTEGVRVEGAGPERTVIAGPGLAGARIAALCVAATNVVLVSCTFSNAVYGVLNANPSVCGKYFAATNCWFVGNKVGLRQRGYAYEMAYETWIQRYSRCRFANNTHDGLWTNARILLDSCLVADNGRYGYCQNGHDANGESMLMNCTIAGNGVYGLYKQASNNAGLKIRNCVVANNPTGAFTGDYGAVSWQYTLFDNLTNQLYSTTLKSTLNGMTDSCITNKPALLCGGTDAGTKYRLKLKSPAARAGSWTMYPWEQTTPTRDLDGTEWKRHLDMGCYVHSPHGMKIIIKKK